MANCEAWIVDCQLAHIEQGGEYQCQAAIWADGQDAAMSLLAVHLDPQGYRILWVNECQPAQGYDRDGALISTDVHEGRPVVLGPVLHKGRQGASESYLTIAEFRDVEPLDAQFGVWPLKTAPDSLIEPLFGQPDPTEAEIKHYGGIDKVPPMRTYAILDAAKVFGLVEMIDASGLEHRCLFKGNAAEDYRDVAPYLVEIEQDNSFTRTLFTHHPDQPQEMTSVHMWHKEPGIYIRSRYTFEHLWKHFRKFTRLYSKETDSWRYFRFYEPNIVGSMIASFNEEAFEKFGAVSYAFMGWTLDKRVVHISRRSGDVPLIPLSSDQTEIA